MGQRLIKKLNRIFIGSMYSIDLNANRTSEMKESKEIGYYVSDFLKKRNYQLKDQPAYEKKS